MTISWLPELLALQAAVSGISSATVTKPGSGYTAPPTVTIDPPPPGGVQATANADMGVSTISVIAPGSGYTTPPVVTITPVDENGLGATATAALATRQVGSVAVGNPGSGYTAPPQVIFSGGGGQGAQATAQISGGVITQVSLTHGGSGYTSVPTVTFTGGSGSGATAVATIASTGALDPTSVSITNAGSDYDSPPIVTVTGGSPSSNAILQAVTSGSPITSVTLNTNGGYDNAAPPLVTIGPPPAGGTQAVGIAVLTLDGAGPDYSVTGISFTGPGLTPGSGYVTPPPITIDPPWYGGGPPAAQAIATAVLQQTITGVNVIHAGAGYSGGPLALAFNPPGGGGITAAGTINTTSASVTSISLESGGTGYTAPINVTIAGSSGSGAGAAAVATPVGVSGITLTEQGAGYTSAPSVTIQGGGGTGATATATLAPTGVGSITVTSPGLGYDAPPAITLTGGGGSGAEADCLMGVTAVSIDAGGYLYGTNPAFANPKCTFTSVDGNGSGAAATLNLTTAVAGGAVFSQAQANTLIQELADVGSQYVVGVPATPGRIPTLYRSPPPVDWAEVDRSARFAASVSSAWFSWDPTWAMLPSSDPGVIMTQRANPLYQAYLAYVGGGGVADPWFASNFLPLYAQAVAAYAWIVQQKGLPATQANAPYEDDSSLGLRLQALVAQAVEMTAYLSLT
jgi:hypothetical protein